MKNHVQLDTLFLDRDGVINEKLNGRYVKDFSEFRFIYNILTAIDLLSRVFKRIIIVTNQQGIGKGLMTEQDLFILHQKMIEEIDRNGGKISKIYFCPHLAKDFCSCRKPDIGMLNKALEDYPDIQIEYSYLVGDSDSDIKAGNRIGLQTVKVDVNYTLYSWAQDLLKSLKL